MVTLAPRQVNPPPHTFGLPMGSVRGIMAVLILGFVWIAVFYPGDGVKLPLGHFFLLPLVLSSFALTTGDDRSNGFLPVVIRLLVIGGTLAAVVYMVSRGAASYQERLTPNYEEFRQYWLAFALTLVGGFFGGHLLRIVLGQKGDLFLTLRAWLSVVGLLMLTGEIAMLAIQLSSRGGDAGFTDFLRAYQFAEVGVVAAYFGTRL